MVSDKKETTKKRVRMHGEERRESILTHAKQVFAHRGYLDASTGELARASEVTEPMLYKHFGNKKGLFLEVMKQCSISFMQVWEQRVEQRAEGDILDALRHVLMDYDDAIAADPDTQKVLFHAVTQAGSDSDIASGIRRHNQRVQKVIHSLLTQAKEQGMLAQDIDLEAAGWGYISMFFAMQYSIVLDLRSDLDRSMFEKINSLWFRAVVGIRFIACPGALTPVGAINVVPTTNKKGVF